MEHVGRRSFLQLVGGATVAGLAIAKVEAAPAVARDVAPLATGLLPGGSVSSLHADSDQALAVPPAREVPADEWFDNRIELLKRRGLLLPCPNCRTVAWRDYGSRGDVLCGTCGWLDQANTFAPAWPCSCEHCRRYFGRYRIDATLEDIQLAHGPWTRRPIAFEDLQTADVGLYEVLSKQRTILNHYDVSTGRYLHHVVERMLARVECAFVVLARRGVGLGSAEVAGRQANGNRILTYWEIVDCYEQQVERGEKPAITYLRNPDGSATLVQGVTRA